MPHGMRINPQVIRPTCTECKGEVPYNDDAVLFDLCLRALVRQSPLKGSGEVSGVVSTGDIVETAQYHMEDPWKKSKHIFQYHNCRGTPEVAELIENETWTLPDGKLRPATPSELEHVERIVGYMHELEDIIPRLKDERRDE